MRLEKAYITTEINHWNDIFRLNQRFMSNFVFRGQGYADWGLKTSLARMVEGHHPNYLDKIMPAAYEERMMEEFQWKYPSYEKSHIPNSDESIEWLSLMQHFGSPTRMLDFSYSMYVAMFMAIDGSFFPKSAIWALNKHELNGKVFAKYREEFNTNVASGADLERKDKNNVARLYDSSHAYYAQKCDILVSNDTRMRVKAEAVYHNTRVLSAEEYLRA